MLFINVQPSPVNGWLHSGALTPLDLCRLHRAAAVILPGTPDPVLLEVEEEGKFFFLESWCFVVEYEA